ncbi:MAG: TolC family protein [Prevotella sp.]|nr:TolC family protein [Prevotella sp.]
MRYFTLTLLTLCCVWDAHAQTLTLDSCRAMALRNNRQLAVGKVQQDIADNIRKSARTKYLPKVSAIGGYELMSKQLSLLSAAQQGALDNIGSTIVSGLSGSLSESVMNLVQNGVISPETALKLQQEMGQKAGELAEKGNAYGQALTDAFKTDTRQVFAGAVIVTQPVYMGGAITAANRMADLQTNLTANRLEQLTHQTLYDIDHTYWLVVSLAHKLKLAQNYNKLVAQLKADVDKMIAEGVATRAEGLKVAVKLNESEVALTQANNGLALAKMLLCQRCGLPLDSQVSLADEDAEIVRQLSVASPDDVNAAIERRPEVKCLNNMVAMTRQSPNSHGPPLCRRW